MLHWNNIYTVIRYRSPPDRSRLAKPLTVDLPLVSLHFDQRETLPYAGVQTDVDHSVNVSMIY
jgi:hypothetical protein